MVPVSQCPCQHDCGGILVDNSAIRDAVGHGCQGGMHRHVVSSSTTVLRRRFLQVINDTGPSLL